MKKLNVFIITCCLFSTLVSAQGNIIKISFSKDIGSNLNYIYASINGITEKFLFDTGASGVSISSSFFNRLINLGLLKKSDYIKNIDIIGINNTKVNAKVYNAESLSIDNFRMRDIEIFVMPDPNAILIIGQNVFQKFGKITIDYNNQIIQLEKSSGTNVLGEVRLIPCSVKKNQEIIIITQILNSSIKPSKISEEKNVPPPKRAIDRLYDGITIRFFDSNTMDIALQIKKELEKSNNYKNTDFFIENMIPYYPQPIQKYIEIWIK